MFLTTVIAANADNVKHCIPPWLAFLQQGNNLLIYKLPVQYDVILCYLVDLLVLLGGRAITLVRDVKLTSP